MKPIPGGPFVKITSDVFPFVVGVVAIVLGVARLRPSPIENRVMLILLVHVAEIGVGNAFFSVYSFWTRPFARGQFLGW